MLFDPIGLALCCRALPCLVFLACLVMFCLAVCRLVLISPVVSCRVLSCPVVFPQSAVWLLGLLFLVVGPLVAISGCGF